jgi:methionyl-tRNA synthetase
VNSDLVGKLVNIASRCAGFVSRRLGGRLAAQLPYPGLYQEFLDAGEDIATAYEHREYSRAMRELMRLADRANQYIDARKPWAAIKEAGREAEVLEVCTQGLNLFRVLITWLHPVLPRLTADAAAFLGTDDFSWNSVRKPLLDHAINPFKPLLKRVERGQIDALLAASRQDLSTAGGKAADQPAGQPVAEETAPQVDIDSFLKVDLRVARILQAATVDGSDKLLKLELDLGERRCTVFAGIRGAYEPQELTGRLTVVVANLMPRKMRFGTSEGMVLAAAEGNGTPFLLSPDSGALPGMRVR